jgi:hypothetical protein
MVNIKQFIDCYKKINTIINNYLSIVEHKQNKTLTAKEKRILLIKAISLSRPTRRSKTADNKSRKVHLKHI